jgi:probable H4MPT-linked C1 transfer pathway protein
MISDCREIDVEFKMHARSRNSLSISHEIRPVASSGSDQTRFLAIDIGGANLKFYHEGGCAVSRTFAMWLRAHELDAVIAEVAGTLARVDAWGVTMTGEMADGFENRADGVRVIVEQTMKAAARLSVSDVGFYATSGALLSAQEATQKSRLVASANWHALSKWIATWIDRPSLLVDVGSTTADLIPVSPGNVDTKSQTDFDRLCADELVYLGISRTPVCSLVDALPVEERWVPVMREWFASVDDCAIILGLVEECAADTDTCDKRPRLPKHAATRLARMIGLDGDDLTWPQLERMAKHVIESARARLALAAAKHETHARSQWIISGHAKPLIEVPVGVPTIALADRLGNDVSRVAPAYAIFQMMQSGQLVVPCARG